MDFIKDCVLNNLNQTNIEIIKLRCKYEAIILQEISILEIDTYLYNNDHSYEIQKYKDLL
jgi:hypothetical protein